MDKAARAEQVKKPRSVECASVGQVALVALVGWKCNGGQEVVWLQGSVAGTSKARKLWWNVLADRIGSWRGCWRLAVGLVERLLVLCWW